MALKPPARLNFAGERTALPARGKRALDDLAAGWEAMESEAGPILEGLQTGLQH